MQAGKDLLHGSKTSKSKASEVCWNLSSCLTTHSANQHKVKNKSPSEVTNYEGVLQNFFATRLFLCLFVLFGNLWLQRLNTESNFSRWMWVLSIKCFDDALTDHTAIFIICLRQHDNKLGKTATRKHIAQPQISHSYGLQIIHCAI